jgi:hypothetical protein
MEPENTKVDISCLGEFTSSVSEKSPGCYLAKFDTGLLAGPSPYE